MIRYTAWLSNTERAGLDQLAKERGTSVNYIVRTLIREALGLHVTAEPPDVTAVTRNK